MKQESLYQIYIGKQQALSRNDNVYPVSMVYCPMCETLHTNNTLCQMPMEGSHEIF